ncbi:sterol desaturase family protein [Parvibaculum sp.]|uniref:sterol desaturase family protein n=1 Tax=Parvibaculum sp. TaxID=2024848 RepID=UPI003BA94DC7
MHEFLEGLLHIRDVDQIWILLGLIGVDVGLTWVLRKKYYEAADSACSVAMGLAYAATIAISAGTVLAALYWLRQYAFFDIDWADSALLILAAFVIIDFLFYWYHRAIHEIRFGWAAHVNHHSSQYFNVGTALRSSFVEAWLEPLLFIPVILIGIDPVMAIALLSINHLYQYWLHTRHIGKLGPVEWILNTPSHHRVHHGSNLQYCDKNYAGTFIVWDRLFGTFEEEQEEPVYGIRYQLETRNPVKATFHEWAGIAKDLKKARSLREAMGYLFAAPGWAPDGKGETTRALQAEMKRERMAAKVAS